MKINTILTLMSLTLISTQSFAAKENFDRSKPHKTKIEKPCDVKKPTCKKATKKKMMEKKRQQAQSNAGVRATDYNSSRSNKADGAKAKVNTQINESKSKATDYNSSRSNKTLSKKKIDKKKKDEEDN